jgi:glyoxylase-like metal-dependent hydrolase (beta-lactamase superfamily II)
MTLRIEPHFHQPTSTATFLVWDEATSEAAVIDPVLDYDSRSSRISTEAADSLLASIARQGLTLRLILETHAHADHLTSAHYLRARTGAKVVIGEKIGAVQAHFAPVFDAVDVVPDGRAFDHLAADGEILPLGDLQIQVMHTPGHTAACISYLIEDAAFVGDTLFMPDYGTARTDFPGGDASALYRSIRRLLDLPPQTRIFVGHDYLPAGRTAFVWETTVAEQRKANVQIHDGIAEADFVAQRRARDATLAPPALLLPSLQVNIRAGALPPPDRSGHVFLRLPVTGAPDMSEQRHPEMAL